jgi:hypothetical protein
MTLTISPTAETQKNIFQEWASTEWIVVFWIVILCSLAGGHHISGEHIISICKIEEDGGDMFFQIIGNP